MYTDEEISKARQLSVLDYMRRYEPDELVKVGSVYSTKTHDSLIFWPNSGYWKWYSQGIGGNCALDFLIKAKETPFRDAVKFLLEEQGDIPFFEPLPEAPREPFCLPWRSFDNSRVKSYLISQRGIDPEIIDLCIRFGILYENKYHSCVFVGQDAQSVARYACFRGTKDGYKAEKTSSDKRFGFCLPGNKRDGSLWVCESPIDALSKATIDKLDGLPWQDCYYLALGGTSHKALIQYLTDHPCLRDVYLALDNDDAGYKGMINACRAIHMLNQNRPKENQIRIYVSPSLMHKDFNETLMARRIAEPVKPRPICHSRKNRKPHKQQKTER